MVETAPAAADARVALRLRVGEPRRPAAGVGKHVVAVVCRRQAGPLLVARVVDLRPPLLVSEPRHGACSVTTKTTRGRVLLVSGLQVYPTLSGGHLRTFALANALARRGNEVFVYSFVGRKKDYLARTPSRVQVWPGGINEHVNRSGLGFLAGYGSYALGLP